jgi:small subunit ribosomal protein S17
MSETTQRLVTGQVVSAGKMQKTIVVQAERKQPHPIYGKYVRARTRYYVHDEEGLAKEGQWVKIAPSRPISKKKFWKLQEVIGNQPA